MRPRYTAETRRLEYMWTPVMHPDAPSVQVHYGRQLVRIERVYAMALEKRQLNSAGMRMFGYVLMSLRKEARD